MIKLICAGIMITFPALPAFCYIDPGTGSMLFSFLTGIAVTLFFFMKNLVIKIKTGSYSGRSKAKQAKRHSIVIYSEGKQYWNVFAPVLRELDARKIPCVYYTSGEDDPGLAFEAPLIHREFIGKGNTAYRFLNFLEADICLMTTPGLDVLQLKRSPGVSHYAHILHAVVDTGLYRLFSFDYFDSVFLTGEHQIAGIRELEKKRGLAGKSLPVIGCTYLDVLQEHIAALPAKENIKTVLVAPSWGQNGILKRYGLALLEPLAQSSYNLIIRPHPQSMISETDTVETLKQALSGYRNVEWNFAAENLAALSRSDILISDFSGVIFDYVFLFNRPVLYTRFEFDKRPYDLSDLDEEAWTFRAIREIGTPIEEESFAGIETVLDAAIARLKTDAAIDRLKAQAYMFRGEAGKNAVQEVCKIRDTLQAASPETEKKEAGTAT
ncbi:CDP-glycerol glycerophosphotransferase family protein [Brucepastera parasyntrophica]|uniref:CDP-glycerol glycerophosphotransferase family protein n=1 Tax=Brucepastera parasyntrophica TaxID=2880008 RepID=UPI00210E24E4|nr:CDP-glycerol glycerophosphotransferase family protein [Brucepastera parasyntrophica]ULQ58707.1 CDP-glycerol glycerophosphotransferase family protein [Brucepastera parasyntrophica]